MLPVGTLIMLSDILGLDLRDEREERMLRLHDPAAGRICSSTGNPNRLVKRLMRDAELEARPRVFESIEAAS